MPQASDIVARLASSLGVKDEAPNIALAEEIVKTGDGEAIAALIDLLATGKRAEQGDTIKVLYEVGDREPALISGYVTEFVGCLDSKNNRLVWGCLTALHYCARDLPNAVSDHLDAILAAADAGSVIAKDQAIYILAKLASENDQQDAVVPIILSRLASSAVNQLPMYAEIVQPIMPEQYASKFVAVLENRLEGGIPASKRKRIEKVLRKCGG